MAEAQARFGPGELDTFARGACGDLWRTEWRLAADGPDFADRWRTLVTFLLERVATPPIYWAWSDRRFGAPTGAPVELTLRFEPTWTAPGTAKPLPGQPLPNDTVSSILLTLRRSPSAIFGLVTPFSRVDAEFAAWERALCESLGTRLGESRWSLTWLPADWTHGRWKFEQGRYRRQDWTAEGLADAPSPGPWDAELDTLLAMRVKEDQIEACTARLLDLPVREVALALLHRMAALKGAPLERGRRLLHRLAEREATREALAPAVAQMFASPPAARPIREMALGLAPVSGDDWFLDLLQPHLDATKIATSVLDFLEELYMFQDEASQPTARARVLVALLRRLRADGAWSRRATFRNCLRQVDDGSAWATWVLEAATPAKGYANTYETWASDVLRRWERRENVRDPAARPWLARLPQVAPYPDQGLPESLEVTLDAEQRAALAEVERRWLGVV